MGKFSRKALHRELNKLEVQVNALSSAAEHFNINDQLRKVAFALDDVKLALQAIS